MSVSSAIRRLVEKGFTMEQALLAAEVFESEGVVQPEPRTARQERNARYYKNRKSRLNHASESVLTSESVLEAPPLAKGVPPHPLTKTQPSPSPLASLAAVSQESIRARDFDIFWQAYPAKVGKDAARKSFGRLVSAKRVTLDELLDGIARYRRDKPEDRAWCFPTTWLNQGRWADEYVTPPARAGPQRGWEYNDVLGRLDKMHNGQTSSDDTDCSSGAPNRDAGTNGFAGRLSERDRERTAGPLFDQPSTRPDRR